MNRILGLALSLIVCLVSEAYPQTELKRVAVPSVKLEAESFKVLEASEGCFGGPQRMATSKTASWSGDSQLTFRTTKAGDAVRLQFDVAEAGNYFILLHTTKAKDYGIVSFWVNSKQLAADFDGFNDEVANAQPLKLGIVSIKKGSNTLEVRTVGKNPKSNGFLWGVDFLALQRIDDLQLLQGTWQTVHRLGPKGKQIPKGDPRHDQVLEIKDDTSRMTVQNPPKGWKPMLGTFKLTPSDTPKSFDFSGTGPLGFPTELHGIYDITEDTFKMSVMQSPKGAPFNRVKEFDGERGGDYFVFKRVGKWPGKVANAKDSVPPLKASKDDNPVFAPLDIGRVATVASTRIFNEESLLFPRWGEQTYHGVPFVLKDPDGGRAKNTICLFSPLGAISQKMPRTVRLPCILKAKEIHFLGASGWGDPWTPKGTLSMVVKLEYEDGKKEDHKLLNGVHLTDWAMGTDVPESKNIGVLRVRHFSIIPKHQDRLIKDIEFHKGTDQTSPFVIAVTVEKTNSQTVQQPKKEVVKDIAPSPKVGKDVSQSIGKVLTADYYPHAAGTVKYYYFEINDNGKYSVRNVTKIEFGEKGAVQTTPLMRKALFDKKTLKLSDHLEPIPLQDRKTTVSDVKVSKDFIEDQRPENPCLPIFLKTGAKKGDSWSLRHNDIETVYTINNFSQSDSNTVCEINIVATNLLNSRVVLRGSFTFQKGVGLILSKLNSELGFGVLTERLPTGEELKEWGIATPNKGEAKPNESKSKEEDAVAKAAQGKKQEQDKPLTLIDKTNYSVTKLLEASELNALKKPLKTVNEMKKAGFEFVYVYDAFSLGTFYEDGRPEMMIGLHFKGTVKEILFINTKKNRDTHGKLMSVGYSDTGLLAFVKFRGDLGEPQKDFYFNTVKGHLVEEVHRNNNFFEILKRRYHETGTLNHELILDDGGKIQKNEFYYPNGKLEARLYTKSPFMIDDRNKYWDQSGKEINQNTYCTMIAGPDWRANFERAEKDQAERNLQRLRELLHKALNEKK